ncbi:hypothetical protein F5X97DRAFT_322406 [Nemania serpens]|nr:hypothetical protein F5X97DRAFT_322406 [Nemania serpens]
MPTQIVAPVPRTPPRKSNYLGGSSDLFASLNATLESKGSKHASPIRTIQERDWDVPAPPPPSPYAALLSLYLAPSYFSSFRELPALHKGTRCIGSTQKPRVNGVHGSLV